ncbi:unnamed protein product [Mytilus coruscus]|uniref:Uncharacterized protein n=1 Tax=Mytilus coruscus TaxID=42192 RepID=A0A6J8AFH4_MYTCO|nr:unnamed protein product [Mytilus coruscus]
MLPKPKAFYMEAILPELASPRHNKYPGIREPDNWFQSDLAEGPSTSSLIQSGKRKQKDHKLNTSVSGESACSSKKRRSCMRSSKQKFVGRHIMHEWFDEETNSNKWYKGVVITVLKKLDGDEDAVYEVLYEGCDDSYEIDHLAEDFRNSS